MTQASWLCLVLAAQLQTRWADEMWKPYESWNESWERLRAACHARGLHGHWAEGRDKEPEFRVAPRATPGEVESVETAIGFLLPTALREVVLDYSASVSVLWQLPDGMQIPVEFKQLFSRRVSLGPPRATRASCRA
jgi:hypothetical protein